MIATNHLEEILLKPSMSYDHLIVVSGYVSGTMCLRHVYGNQEYLQDSLPEGVSVDIVFGMYLLEGISKNDHRTFLDLTFRRKNFRVHYYNGQRPLHSKVYVWCKSGMPQLAFVGSLNYSVSGFFGHTEEVVVRVIPHDVYEYAKRTLKNSVLSVDVENPKMRNNFLDVSSELTHLSEFDALVSGLDRVTLPLWAIKSGSMHLRSGLNWGQREHRDKNQAYIPVPTTVARQGFFPRRGDFFTIMTDDGEVFDCVIAQDNDKAIHTPLDNAIFGRYFRSRLGVPSGAPVTINHLDQYGRRDVTVYKASDATFFLDFRSRSKIGL